MTVSTPVIVAITILGCCLVITSALLVYKLRPDVQQFSSKWSGYSSEPPSPVRKMTVVHGVVVEDNVKRPSRAFLPRWSTLYTSRRTSTASSLGSHASLILGSQVDLEAQLGHEDEKIPQVNIQEYLGFEKSRRARKVRQHRNPAMKIPPPLMLHSHSSSTDDELRVSPSAFAPAPPLSAPAALSREGSLKDVTDALPVVEGTEPARRHSTPASALLNMPQTRGAFNVAFLQAASISALPPTAYSARATPEPSIRLSMTEIPDLDGTQSVELRSPLESSERDEGRPRTARQGNRDLETIVESTSGSDTAAAPPPVVPLLPKNHRSKSSPRPMSRKIREASLLQRLGRNRPSPIRSHVAANTNDSSNVDTLSPSAPQTAETTSDVKFQNPFPTTSAPITPPVLSANIVNGIPSYPSFFPSGAKSRQSTATISSSQYSPTFSLASVQRVPLFAGKLSPLGTDSSVPVAPLVVPSSGMVQSIPASSYKIAAGLRRPRKSPTGTGSSAFPKPPTSLRNSPVSSTFPAQHSAAGKRVHIASPLAKRNSMQIPAVGLASITAAATSLPPDRPRRPSRYSHLIDKDLPAPPPNSTIVATLLEAHLRPHAHSVSQEVQIPKQKLPLLQSPKSSPFEAQRIPNTKPLPTQASPIQQTLPPFSPPARRSSRAASTSALSTTTQQSSKSSQDPKPPVMPHVRSQSLSSKGSSETQQANLTTTTTNASATNHAHNDSALASSPTINPIDAVETGTRTRSNSHAATSTATTSNKPLPAELQLNLNLDLSGGSELGLDFGRGAFGF